MQYFHTYTATDFVLSNIFVKQKQLLLQEQMVSISSFFFFWEKWFKYKNTTDSDDISLIWDIPLKSWLKYILRWYIWMINKVHYVTETVMINSSRLHRWRNG